MKVWNIKLNKSRLMYLFISILLILLCIFLISLYINNKTIIMNNSNYTTILRDSHKDISNNFNSNQFVVARDMLINDSEANIVGFLCEYPQATEFEDNVWVEISGTLTLGDYFGPIPIIKIDTIKRITTPEDIFVYPPK